MSRCGCDDDANVTFDGMEDDRCMVEEGNGRGREDQGLLSKMRFRASPFLETCVNFAMGLKEITKDVGEVVLTKDLPTACFCMSSDVLRYRF